MYKKAQLLLLYEDTEDKDILIGHLGKRFSLTDIRRENDRFEHAFSTAGMELVLLALTDVEHSTDVFLQISQHNCDNHAPVPPFVLMCTMSDSRKACAMVRDRLFQDFIIFKPMFDPEHAKFRVERVLEREHLLLVAARMPDISRGTADIADQLRRVRDDIGSSCQLLTTDYTSAINNTRTSVNNQLDRLGERVGDTPSLSAMKKQLLDVMREQIETTVHGSLSALFEKLEHDVCTGVERSLGRHAAEVGEQANSADALRVECGETKPLVVVIDDDRDVGETIASMIELIDLECHHINDPRSALPVLLSRVPDLVLLDIDMPHVNGLDMLGNIKSHDALHDVPVVMITGRATVDNVAISKQGGATGFIAKPIDIDALHRRVTDILKLPTVRRRFARLLQ